MATIVIEDGIGRNDEISDLLREEMGIGGIHSEDKKNSALLIILEDIFFDGPTAAKIVEVLKNHGYSALARATRHRLHR